MAPTPIFSTCLRQFMILFLPSDTQFTVFADIDPVSILCMGSVPSPVEPPPHHGKESNKPLHTSSNRGNGINKPPKR